MACLDPIVLKSGVVVPCGKCDICRSNARNEWSIRLAIHLQSCDTMPLFITLTYDDGHLPYRCIDYGDGSLHTFSLKDVEETPEMQSWCSFLYPSLHRYHVSRFLKAYKRKYGLYNKDFQYFGCGEYGDKFGRPHYHLLFFGDKELYTDYFDDIETAQMRIKSCWHYGHVHVGIAGFDGIHYVTKYALKDGLDEIGEYAIKPFTIASNGLGMNFLNSDIGHKIVDKLEWCQRNKDKIIAGVPDFDFRDMDSVKNAVRYFEKYLPRFSVILDDGRQVYLPRAIRRRLVGSFEHFKDSVYWNYNYLKTLCESNEYYDLHGNYDMEHDVNFSRVALNNRLEKIQKRLLERKYNLKNLTRK